MKALVSLALASLLVGSLACAASPEDDYLAARKGHFETIAAAEKAKKSEAEIQKLDEAALADLKTRAIAALGLQTFPGVPTTPTYRPETLLGGQLESGAADGLRYASETADSAYLVSSEKILLTWARERAVESKGIAKALKTGVAGLFANNEVITSTIGVDAAFESFLELPLEPQAGVVARAAIGGFSQDVPLAPPPSLVVALASGGRVVIATVAAKTKVADPKACAGLKKKADPAYVACVAKALKASPQFAEVTREAETLAAALRGK